MDPVITILSTREWALFIIFALIVALALYSDKTRGAFLLVLETLFQRQIVSVFLAGAVYLVAAVYGLKMVGLWTVGDVSSTVIWALTSATVGILNFEKAKKEARYYRKAFWEVFTLTTIFVFVTDLLDISLWFWLAAIPFLTLIHLMVAFSEGKSEHTAAHKLLSWVQALLGFALFFYVASGVADSWAQVATLESIRLFALSGALSIVFLPFIYGLVLYTSYQTAFGMLPVTIEDRSVRRAASWRAIWQFRTDLEFLERWHRRVAMASPKTKEELYASFEDIKAVKARESNPQPVDPSEGWEPQAAIAFLQDDALKPNDYRQILDLDEWSASSPYLEFSDGVWPNSVGYYVTGSALAATKLELKLNINQPEDSTQAREGFALLCQKLLTICLGYDATQSVAAKISELEEFEERAEHATVTLKVQDWSRLDGGYALLFTVSTKSTE